MKLLVGELTFALPDRAARRAPPKGRHPLAAPAPNRQALLVLAHLRCGDTYTRLAASFGIGVATVHRYIREAVDLLAALVPTLQQTLNRAAAKAFVILDGTLLPMDRIAADRPFRSGKYRKHGMNVQVLTGPFGRLLWASAALPGAVHGIKAARTHGVINASAEVGLVCHGDKGYQGAGGTVRVPFRGKHRDLSGGHMRSHAPTGSRTKP